MKVLGPRSKRYILGAAPLLCVLISLIDYCKDGNIPLLKNFHGGFVVHSFSSDSFPTTIPVCNCNCTGSLSSSQDYHYAATVEPQLLPRQEDDLVPMKVLKEKIDFSEKDGLKYLDHVSLSRYYLCKPSRMLLLPNNALSDQQCNKRKFLDLPSPVVALVSFHGSGNTWVRHLMEQATGVFTGSIYCDPGLKVAFPGESVVSGNVIVTKTHRSDSMELPGDIATYTGKRIYDKAILLVRNPYDALVSEANRRWNSKHSVNDHLGVAAESAFVSKYHTNNILPNKNIIMHYLGNSKWDWLIEYKGATWAFLLHTWLAQRELPVLVVQYEALIDHTEQELMRILKFLNFSSSNSSIECAVKNGDGMFKRTKHLDFNPYSAENREALNRYIKQAAPLLAQHGIIYELK